MTGPVDEQTTGEVVAVPEGQPRDRYPLTFLKATQDGVTLFGVFLTPVFFFVIQGFGESRWFSGLRVRKTASWMLGGVLGLAVGYLLGDFGLVPLFWLPAGRSMAQLISAAVMRPNTSSGTAPGGMSNSGSSVKSTPGLCK